MSDGKTQHLQFFIPSGWQRAKGFSYGVAAPGRVPLFVAGQLAVVDGAHAPDEGMGIAEQFSQCLRNIVHVVESAGGRPQDVASLRVFITSIDGFKKAQGQIGEDWRRILGSHFPAMTMVEVAALFESTAQVEIEAVALLKEEIFE